MNAKQTREKEAEEYYENLRMTREPRYPEYQKSK